MCRNPVGTSASTSTKTCDFLTLCPVLRAEAGIFPDWTIGQLFSRFSMMRGNPETTAISTTVKTCALLTFARLASSWHSALHAERSNQEGWRTQKIAVSLRCWLTDESCLSSYWWLQLWTVDSPQWTLAHSGRSAGGQQKVKGHTVTGE